MAAKPIAGKKVLDNNHSASNHDGVGDAQIVIAGETVAAEDSAADDGLQQIVSKTHTTEDAEMVEHPTHAVKGIPG